MKILGIDFTSTPSKRKPIIIADCDLDRRTLHLSQFHLASDFAAFETLLQSPGPWVAGFDFPFGLPLDFLRAARLPSSWCDYVATIERGGKEKFEFAVQGFMVGQPESQKRPRRIADQKADSASPLNIVNPPVGKMFFTGAPRLLAAGINIKPCCPNKDRRIALETYPAIFARALAGVKRLAYKSDSPAKESKAKAAARRTILEGLRDAEKMESYGVSVAIPSRLQNDVIVDSSGDRLDAILCAVQAAWAYGHRQQNWGISPGHEEEGWIVDPHCVDLGSSAD
ncbi:MAG TPA: DUF429 domain-containing protein [Terriglobales bacterium]|nr:DUF429 domain-containing protein [Terriglobales bacterium]